MLESKHKRHFVIADHLLSESALDSIATQMKPWGKLLTKISGFSMTAFRNIFCLTPKEICHYLRILHELIGKFLQTTLQ